MKRSSSSVTLLSDHGTLAVVVLIVFHVSAVVHIEFTLANLFGIQASYSPVIWALQVHDELI